MEKTYKILKDYFGYDEFRYGQEDIINDILAGKDALGIMPTGAGKSLCFQVPALIMPGITIVVSPLISLMKDQVNALNQMGAQAAYINSSLTERQIDKVLTNAQMGAYKLIYVAPERLPSTNFLAFCHGAEIPLVAVDEAHCVSMWGQDFRPSYTAIPNFLANLPQRPILAAFTATATPRVKEDIVNKLSLKKPTILVSTFDRPNLYFGSVQARPKFNSLLKFLEKKGDVSGIIYCSTRKEVDRLYEKLSDMGYAASRYHAGLSDAERNKNQDDFLYDRITIMVATNAFGMGIDKSNVSFVLHYNMPKDIESYYQEAGRAGRDGAAAECVMFYGPGDYITIARFFEDDEPNLRAPKMRRLDDLMAYCETKKCLRSHILEYFGENPIENCGNCSNCVTNFKSIDVTIDAQKIISCVIRMKRSFGYNMLIEILQGKKTTRIRELGFDKLSTFGISDRTNKQLRDIINHLMEEGYLYKSDDGFAVIKLGEHYKDVLKKNAFIEMKVAEDWLDESKQDKKEMRREAVRTSAPLRAVNPQLFDALKELRAKFAQESNAPAFTIFHDSSLMDMCLKMPKNLDEFLEISGVGQVKADRYGSQFLEIISNFAEEETIPFITKEYNPADVEISDEAVTISAIADRLNVILLQSGKPKLTGQKINDYLVLQGMLEIVEFNGKNYKIATATGQAAGITTEEREMRGENIKINLFNKEAQIFIVENIPQFF